MAGIRGKNTRPEIVVRGILHRRGFRFRIHAAKLPGKPDIVLPKFHAVILVHGCFWHGHDCPLFKWPATRPDFWKGKIERNRTNDKKATDALLLAGWRVGTVWECAMKGVSRLGNECIGTRLASWLQGEDRTLEIRGNTEGQG